MIFESGCQNLEMAICQSIKNFIFHHWQSWLRSRFESFKDVLLESESILENHLKRLCPAW